MTDKTELEVTREDREAAWPYRADCYREEDSNGWLRGKYDHNRIIQAFARHRLATRTPDPTPAAPADGLVEALRAELAWHEDHDKAISKQPNANTGDNGWRRMDHQERVGAITAALKAKGPGHEQ